MTLQNLIVAIIAGTLIKTEYYEVKLARQEFLDNVINSVLPENIIPIVRFNKLLKTINIDNRLNILYTNEDIFIADDWIILE